jgi:hypothetical protein
MIIICGFLSVLTLFFCFAGGGGELQGGREYTGGGGGGGGPRGESRINLNSF